jgi:hypothetical protein
MHLAPLQQQQGCRRRRPWEFVGVRKFLPLFLSVRRSFCRGEVQLQNQPVSREVEEASYEAVVPQ